MLRDARFDSGTVWDCHRERDCHFERAIVILSEAKDLVVSYQILRCAQDDRMGSGWQSATLAE
jgi:hypothetical protein